MSDDMFYARVCAERDQLRAELARLQRNEDCVQRLIVWAAENGWNGVDNSKILDSFIVGLFDELRAELAAAKNLLARIHRDGGHHTEAVGFAQSVTDAEAKVSEWLLAAEGRIALAALGERLVSVIGCFLRDAKRAIPTADDTWPDWYCCLCGVVGAHDDECTYPVAEAALAATPAQSLAAHDAAVKVAVLREVARMLGAQQRELLLAEADRIEKEAVNG